MQWHGLMAHIRFSVRVITVICCMLICVYARALMHHLMSMRLRVCVFHASQMYSLCLEQWWGFSTHNFHDQFHCIIQFWFVIFFFYFALRVLEAWGLLSIFYCLDDGKWKRRRKKIESKWMIYNKMTWRTPVDFRYINIFAFLLRSSTHTRGGISISLPNIDTTALCQSTRSLFENASTHIYDYQ